MPPAYGLHPTSCQCRNCAIERREVSRTGWRRQSASGPTSSDQWGLDDRRWPFEMQFSTPVGETAEAPEARRPTSRWKRFWEVLLGRR